MRAKSRKNSQNEIHVATFSCKGIILFLPHIYILLFSHQVDFCIDIKISSQLHYICSHRSFKLLLHSVLTCLGKRWTMSVRLNEIQNSYHFLVGWWRRAIRFFFTEPLPSMYCGVSGRQTGD